MIKLVAIRRDGSLAEHTVMSSEVETSLFAEPELCQKWRER